MVEFKKFKVSELFDYKRGKESAPKKVPEGDIPLISETSSNNGFVRGASSTHVFPAKTITVSVNYAQTVFLQPKEFCASVNIIILVPKFDNVPDAVLLYFVALLRANNGVYDYNYKISKDRLMNTVLLVPVVSDGTLDFEYMTMQIRELEAERIRELEAYLSVTGLDNTTLSASEVQALTQDVKWKKFRIGDVFEKPGKGDVDLQNDDVDGIGEYFINSGETNLGIKGRTSREAKVFPKNTITIDFFGNVYYRDFSYKLATHNHVFSFQLDLIKSREIGLYLVGALGYLKKKFSYHNMLTWNKLKKLDIQLPVTATGDIDFDYMQNYIRATEKQTIKDVVEYKDRVIEETKKVVNE